jgi:hypothetical protein
MGSVVLCLVLGLLLEIEDGVFYDVRVRLQNSLGVWSEYAQDHHKVLGKTAKPTDVSGLSVTEMPDGTRFLCHA